jgi:hypothetical protein
VANDEASDLEGQPGAHKMSQAVERAPSTDMSFAQKRRKVALLTGLFLSNTAWPCRRDKEK